MTCDKMRKDYERMRDAEKTRIVDEWKAANGYNDLLAAYSASVSEANRLRKLFDDAGQGVKPATQMLRRCSRKQIRNAVGYLRDEAEAFERDPVGDEKALRACIEWMSAELRRRRTKKRETKE